MMIFIGIDTGVNTGYARMREGKLEFIKTLCIIEALEYAKADINLSRDLGCSIKFFIEDARKRKWVTGGREKLQGVGSVKRDCGIWEEFCVYHGIDFALVAPKDNHTKLSADTFARLTGYQGRTSEHGRDAAMLIWGRR